MPKLRSHILAASSGDSTGVSWWRLSIWERGEQWRRVRQREHPNLRREVSPARKARAQHADVLRRLDTHQNKVIAEALVLLERHRLHARGEHRTAGRGGGRAKPGGRLGARIQPSRHERRGQHGCTHADSVYGGRAKRSQEGLCGSAPGMSAPCHTAERAPGSRGEGRYRAQPREFALSSSSRTEQSSSLASSGSRGGPGPLPLPLPPGSLVKPRIPFSLGAVEAQTPQRAPCRTCSRRARLGRWSLTWTRDRGTRAP